MACPNTAVRHHHLPGHGKAGASLDQSTTCLQSQIGRHRYLRRRGTAQVEAGVVLSVVIRSGPVATGVNGTLVARLDPEEGALGLRPMTSHPGR